MTLRAALTEATQKISEPTPQLDAEVLLGYALKKEKAWIFSHLDDELSLTEQERFFQLAERRSSGEPVAYLTGVKSFYGRDFLVSKDVLIPRPETELMIDLLKEHWRHDRRLRILDVGTGSGCLAVTASLEFPQSKVTAVDKSPRALTVAQSNAKQLRADRVVFQGSDLLHDLEKGERFDIIMANLPYLTGEDLIDSPTSQELSYEPRSALYSDDIDGLSLVKECTKQALTFLQPGGRIYLEMMPDQVPVFLAWVEQEQLPFQSSVTKDLAGYDRIIVLQIQ